MAHIVIIGAGIAGLPAAYELRKALEPEHNITLINETGGFRFVPSNPWVAIGRRTPSQVSISLRNPVWQWQRFINFIVETVIRVYPEENRIQLADKRNIFYDYLMIATGPKPAFDEIPGLRSRANSISICTLEHAQQAWEQYREFLKNPGPVVIGAVQGASFFGPTYEFAMIVDTDLRKRRLRHKAPITFVTSEPYIGHLGLGGVGNSRNSLERELQERDIRWINNARIERVEVNKLIVAEHDTAGALLRRHELPAKLNMLMPAFKGVDAVSGIEGLSDPHGFILIDRYQRNPKYRNIFAAGVCVAVPPAETTPVPTGAPKTGYMIESMVTAVVHNIQAELEGRQADVEGSWSDIRLADMGDHSAVFVAMPKLLLRNVAWSRRGRWMYWTKVLFEKYFLYKMKLGLSEPFYKRIMLRLRRLHRTG